MTANELLAIFGAAATLVGGAWAMLKILVSQFEARLKERFDAQESARNAGREESVRRTSRIEETTNRLERELLTLKADLPVQYVRREDAIRQETVINAKLDALATRLDLIAERQKKE